MKYIKLLAEVSSILETRIIETNEESSLASWDDVAGVLRRNGKETAVFVKEEVAEEILSRKAMDLLVDEELAACQHETEFAGVEVSTFAINLSGLQRLAEEEDARENKAAKATAEVNALKQQLRLARAEADQTILMEQFLGQLAPRMNASTPKVGKYMVKPGNGNKALAGIPTLFLSDWHWGEVVDPLQVEGLNEFNLREAAARAKRTFNQTLEMLLTHMGGMRYDGIVVALGGDMVSGNIHEELQRTNEAEILDICLDLTDHLYSGIATIAKEFPKVYVPGVVGNHGRLERKPSAKGKVRDNFDYLVYSMLQRYFQDSSNVCVDVADSADMRFNIYNTRFLLTHGDQIKGGSGVGGIWPSMMKTDQRKRKRHQIAGGGYDHLVVGHFHRYGTVDGVICNGSLKGYDEWVYTMNFDWEPPQQALWVTHPDYGITNHMPIYAEQREKGRQPAVDLPMFKKAA